MSDDSSCPSNGRCCLGRKGWGIAAVVVALPLVAMGWIARESGLSVDDMRSYLASVIEPRASKTHIRIASTQPARERDPWHPQVLKTLLHFNTVNLQLTGDQLGYGGVPKDGIAALTQPTLQRAADADDMTAGERVIDVTVNGKRRAYPIAVLNRHEVINDELGGVPIGVFFCPLCDSVSVVDRHIAGRTLEFGVSGLVSNSNVLFYDRQDHALWSQIGLRAVSGPLAGRSLSHLNDWRIVPFEKFKADAPQARYVSKQTGHDFAYEKNPYASYLKSKRLMFEVDHEDQRYPRKSHVIGVQLGDTVRAYPLVEVVAAMKATGRGEMSDRIDGRPLRLAADQDHQSVRIIEAPGDAKVVHTFWFAWAAFYPETEIFKTDPFTMDAK